MKLTDAIDAWELIRTKDTGKLRLYDFLDAIERTAGLQNDVKYCSDTLIPSSFLPAEVRAKLLDEQWWHGALHQGAPWQNPVLRPDKHVRAEAVMLHLFGEVKTLLAKGLL